MHRNFTNFTVFLLLFLSFSITSNAQVFEGFTADSILKGARILRFDAQNNNLQYAQFEENDQIYEEQIFSYWSKIYNLNSDYSFSLIRSEKDDLGLIHNRYQIQYKKTPILGSILISHIKDKRMFAFNGDVYTVKESNSIATVTEQTCLQIALDSIHAETYLWQIPEEEQIIKDILEDEHASWFPKGKLVFVPENMQFKKGEFHLCYVFNIHAAVPRSAENIYISAKDGRLIARENQLHTTDVPGKAQTKYSGTQNIITDSTAPFNYRLRENTRGNGIYTFNMNKGTNYGAATDFLDSNNYWNNVNANEDEIATDAHWGAETTYDYFKNKFNRNSYNNNNARINSYVHYANNYDNAFWDGFRMTYGDGNTFSPLTCLDVCGHEIAHAVTSNSANLIYSYESGQLNESFSDIFGNAVERYGKPNDYSWIIGEEITSNGSGLRNMSDPRIKGHPRCYQGTNWYYGAGDNGGVHLNSGVQNWWFYLITEGGSGLNDFANAYKVDSLGIETAEKIAYRNLTVYLTPTSQYSDARFYSIQSALDIYGPCSKEVISVTNAWYACAVGAKYDSGFVKAAFTADTVICSSSKTVKFYNKSTNASYSTWYFGDGNTSNDYNATHVYSTYGTFTVKLRVNSCFKNNSDSVTRTSYIKIDSTFDICNALVMPKNGIDSSSKCSSLVYDDGGEDVYEQLRTTYFVISTPGADSIRINFLDFDYELNYDSLYIYQGYYPGGIKIGGYTGSTLPNAGNSILVPGAVVTLRHVSDPYVIGRGFKLRYKSIKKPIDVKGFSDTSICYGTSVRLNAVGSGGYFKDYRYEWVGLTTKDTLSVSPIVNTHYKVRLKDVCTGSKDSANVMVVVRKPLDLKSNNDTLICYGNSVNLFAYAKGGDSSKYTYTWDNSLGNGTTKNITPLSNTTYRVIVSDACSPKNDTAFVKIRVKDKLRVNAFTNDSIICYNKVSSITANGSGGDTMRYMFVWEGFGIGANIKPVLQQSKWIKVSLNDMCSPQPAKDSVFVVVRAPLSIDLNNDTTICYGNFHKIIANVSGGDASNYSFQWFPPAADSAIVNVKPNNSTMYVLTLIDKCSNSIQDSTYITVLDPIVVGGLNDTDICRGMQVPLIPIVTGGKSSSYTYTWNSGLGSTSTQIVTPNGNNNYRVIVNDGCTVLGDTAFAQINVSGPLRTILRSNDTIICYGKDATINVNGVGGKPSGYVFNWSHGLGSGTSKTINLNSSTWIKTTLTDACTVLPNIDSIYIDVRPEMKISLPKDTLICKGSNMILNAITIGGDTANYQYTWNQSLSNNKSHTISPAINTMYTVELTDNCSDNSKDTMWVNVMPELNITGLRDTVICYGQNIAFTPQVSGGITAQYQYTWNNGLSNSKNQIVQPLSFTTYIFKLEDNCSSPYDSVKFTVAVRQALDIKSSLSKKTICEKDTSVLNLKISGGIPTQYQWTLNGVSTTLQSIKLSPAISTQYIVSLSDMCSAPFNDTVNLLVNPLPIIDFTASKTIVCQKERVQFTNNSTGGVFYIWNFSPQDSTAITTPVFAYPNPGIYNVKLQGFSDSGCVNTLEKSAYMDVHELPISKFTYLPEVPDFLNRQVAFSNLSTNQNTFEWDFGDFNTETTITDPLHTYPDTGHFPVQLIVKNTIGCADTMEQMLRVKDVFRVFIPDAITMNGDHINDSFIVLGRGIQTYNLKIYNRWGEMVYKGDMGGKPFEGKDKNGLPLIKGTYVVYLTVRDFEGFMHYVRQVLEIL